MAAIPPPGKTGKRRPSLTGVLMQDVSQSKERSRRWPTKRGKAKTPEHIQQVEWFRQAQWATKYWWPQLAADCAKAVAGTALLPRDLMTMIMANRFIGLVFEDGRVWWPMTAVQDVSASLDVIGNTPGYILRRGTATWEIISVDQLAHDWWWDPPSAADFTLATGLASNLLLGDDLDAGLLVQAPAPESGDKTGAAYIALTDKNQPWSLEIHSLLYMISQNWTACGIFMRDSMSGRVTTFCLHSDGILKVVNYNGMAGFAGIAASLTPFPRSMLPFTRVSKIGTGLVFEVSENGKLWDTVAGISETSWLTNKADQVGLCCTYNRSSGNKANFAVDRFILEQ